MLPPVTDVPVRLYSTEDEAPASIHVPPDVVELTTTLQEYVLLLPRPSTDIADSTTIASSLVVFSLRDMIGSYVPNAANVLGVLIGISTACWKPLSSYPPSEITEEQTCFNVLAPDVSAVFSIS